MERGAEASREAHEAWRAWAATGVRERTALVRRLRWRLARDPLGLATAARNGDPSGARECLVSEVLPLLDACRFLEREGPALLAPRRRGARGRPAWLTGVRIEIRREPHGVVLVIGPSNYPLFLPGVQSLQALVAGNCVVLKPGAGGSAAALALRDGLRAAGADGRLFQVLSEDAGEAAGAIRAGVDKVVLTGSAPTGRKVLASLAEELVPATVELSGCDAVLILDSADLGLAAKALAFGLRWNGSETCIAPRRVFVPSRLAPVLERSLAAEIGSLPPRPCRPAVAALLREALDEAVALGARIVAGGPPPANGGEVRPTLVGGARPEMRLLREDIFAPVLSLVEAASTEEALSAIEDCPYALGATVLGDEREALAVARRVRAGVVVVNDAIAPTADPRLPFGGRKRSGFGTTRGGEGLLEMTRIQAIAVRHGSFRPHLEETAAGDEALFESWVRFAHSRGLRTRLAAGGCLLKALWRRRRVAGRGGVER